MANIYLAYGSLNICQYLVRLRQIIVKCYLCRSGSLLMALPWELCVATRKAFGVWGSLQWTSVWPHHLLTPLSRYGPYLIWRVSRHLRGTQVLCSRLALWPGACSLYQGKPTTVNVLFFLSALSFYLPLFCYYTNTINFGVWENSNNNWHTQLKFLFLQFLACSFKRFLMLLLFI